ncbi:MAG: hypothetical protein U0414_44120 [Polyangiaceae bacterium]
MSRGARPDRARVDIDAERRHPIARGSVRSLGTVLVVFIAALTALITFAFGLAPRFFDANWVAGITSVGATLLLVALLAYVNLRGSLEIGTDGLQIDWRNERRFLPFTAVERAELYQETTGGKKMVGVAVALVGGEHVKIPFGEDHFGERARAISVAARIGLELAAFRARASNDDAGALERRDRDVSAWRDHLRGLAAGAHVDARVAPIEDERLFRVAADPHAREDVRAGAAAALHFRSAAEPGADAEARRNRLRVIARETASPKLRIAIESAADGHEDELDDALEDLSGTRAATRS